MTWLDIAGLVPGPCVPVPVSIGQMMIKIIEVPHSNRGIIKLQYPGQKIYRSSPDEVAISGPQNMEEEMLKSEGITLLTKSHLVRAMVIPEVKCGCESWALKKAECKRTDALNCGAGEDS